MSGQYGDPDWANPSAPSSQQPVVESSSWTSNTGGEDFSGAAFSSGGAVAASNVNAAGLGNNASSRGKTNCIQRLLSIFSIGLSAMMCTLGVFGIIEFGALSEIFVCIYMILFAVLLFSYEVVWWTNNEKLNKNLRVNFGFMYGVKGRAAYLIFAAFLVIGLKEDVRAAFLRYLTGGCYLGTGVLMLFLHYSKPELLGKYEASTAGFGHDDINTPV